MVQNIQLQAQLDVVLVHCQGSTSEDCRIDNQNAHGLWRVQVQCWHAQIYSPGQEVRNQEKRKASAVEGMQNRAGRE